MSKFIVIEKGEGEGCDYTIGCNMRFAVVDFDGTLERLVQIKAESAAERREPGIARLIVIPYRDEYEVDLRPYRAALKEQQNREERAIRENAEWAEFERLKKKFGK